MGRKSRDSRRTRVAAEPAPTAPAAGSGRALAALALGWAIPGGGHLWLGRRQKGVVFLLALPLMFAIGLWLEGALAPFDPIQPLVLLAAFADLGNGVPYLIAAIAGLGEGRVVRGHIRVWQYLSDCVRTAEHAGRPGRIRRGAWSQMTTGPT